MPEQLNQVTQVHLPEGYELSTRKRNKQDFGKFQAIGMLSESPDSPPDLIDLLVALPKQAQQLIQLIKWGRDPQTNICIINRPYSNASEQSSFSRSLKSLKEYGLVKKVPVKLYRANKNEVVFILNPALIKCFDINKAQELWFNC